MTTAALAAFALLAACAFAFCTVVLICATAIVISNARRPQPRVDSKEE